MPETITPIPFCNKKLNVSATEEVGTAGRWQHGHLKFRYLRPIPGGLTIRQSEEVTIEAVEDLARFADVSATPTRGNEHADIVISTRSIDTVNGALAEAELARPGDRPGFSQKQMWWDINDRFSLATNDPKPALDVVKHEWCHNLGLTHDQNPSVSSFMDPLLRPGWVVTEADPAVAVLINLYGPAPEISDGGGEDGTDGKPFDFGAFCECLRGINSGDAQELQRILRNRGGNLLDRLGNIFQILQRLMQFSDQIQEFLECFNNLTDSQQVKIAKLVGKITRDPQKKKSFEEIQSILKETKGSE